MYNNNSNSSLSPLSIKKTTGTKLYCEDHPNEKLTNFCFTSFKALCPSCIDSHNKQMRQKNLFPELDTLKNVKVNCSKKISNTILSLQNELGRLEEVLPINAKEIIDEGIDVIRKAKYRLQEHIDKYFEEMEYDYITKLNESLSKLNQVDDLQSKIKGLLSELEQLLCGLDTQSTIDSIKKICTIDGKLLLEKFRKDIDFKLQQRSMISNTLTEIKISEGAIRKIIPLLQRYISLLHKEDPYIPVRIDHALNSINGSSLQSRNASYSQEMNAGSACGGVGGNHGVYSNYMNYVDQSSYQQASSLSSSCQQIQPAFALDNDDIDGMLKFHKTYYNDPKVKFMINMPDYFESNCQRKYLHFFQNHENKMHFIDLDKFLNNNQKAAFEAIELNSNFSIPPFHKSISIPSGDIYLIGGSDPMNNNKKFNTTYIFDFSKKTLLSKASMNVPRSSFAICYMKGYIYVVGGLTNNSSFTSTCEKYDISQNKWTSIADLNHDVLAPCIATFNNKYIFKFGGNSINNKLENHIEKYDPLKNKWYTLQPKIELPYQIKPTYFKILNTSAAIQINQTDIYIFGGYLDDNTGSNQTFIFKLNAHDENEKISLSYTITSIGHKTLPYPEAFWNNNPIIMNKCVFGLQNVQTSEQNDVCLDDKRKLLMFNSIEWKHVL